MPDFSGRLGRSESWITPGSPAEALTAIVAAVKRRGGRTEALGETEAVLLLGSRSAYRMLGMVSPVKTNESGSTWLPRWTPTTQFGSQRTRRVTSGGIWST